jgi:hypothetical protein
MLFWETVPGLFFSPGGEKKIFVYHAGVKTPGDFDAKYFRR